MVTDIRSGPMAPSTRASGRPTKRMALVSWSMQTAMSTRVSGETTRLMVTVAILTLMEQPTSVNGLMISSTVKVWRPGQMVLNTTANISKGRSMVVAL